MDVAVTQRRKSMDLARRRRRLEIAVPAKIHEALERAVQLGLYGSKTELILEALRLRLHTLGLLAGSNPASLDKELQPVLVTYLDHTLGKNVDPASLKPCLRAAVGWIAREEATSLTLIFDRPLHTRPTRLDLADTALSLDKRLILQVRRLKP